MIANPDFFRLFALFLRGLGDFSTMTTLPEHGMVSAPEHGIVFIHTIAGAMRKRCLAVPRIASQCRTRTQKTPPLRGVSWGLMLADAGHCQTGVHSHSMVACDKFGNTDSHLAVDVTRDTMKNTIDKTGWKNRGAGMTRAGSPSRSRCP